MLYPAAAMAEIANDVAAQPIRISGIEQTRQRPARRQRPAQIAVEAAAALMGAQRTQHQRQPIDEIVGVDPAAGEPQIADDRQRWIETVIDAWITAAGHEHCLSAALRRTHAGAARRPPRI